MPEERLQKVIAASGLASRRAAEALIAAGRVRVDGRRATIGQVVDPAKAKVEVDGLPIGDAARTTYLLLHKPSGVTSTTQDRHAESTVLDFVPTAMVPDGARLYPVGRLDQDSEGLLILTNDGGWSEKVLHPRYGVEREYALAVRAPLSYEQVHLLEDGIPLEEGLATVHHLRAMTPIEVERLEELLDPPAAPGISWYRVTLRQGWKRQLRRMFGAIEAPIDRLVRVRIGPVRIDGLASGKIRRLKAPEVRGLGGGGGRSRGDDRPGAEDAAPDVVEATPRGTARPAARPGGPVRNARPSTDRTRSAAAATRKPAAPKPGAAQPGAARPGTARPTAPKPGASGPAASRPATPRSSAPRPATDRPRRKPGRPDAG